MLMSLPDYATKVVAHALNTFGSVRKALGWLYKPCGAFGGAVPVKLLLTGQKDTVEEELVRIEEGIYV